MAKIDELYGVVEKYIKDLVSDKYEQFLKNVEIDF